MSTNNNRLKEKKQPIRKCSGCGEHFPKSELIRVLRTPDEEIKLDLVGKVSGRGAYLCRSAACLKKARKSHRLESSLDCVIPDNVYERLTEEISVNEQ